MNADQLNSVNMWLAILAIASVVQVMALAALGVFGYRLYAHGRRAIDDLERRHVEPLTRRVNGVLDSVSTEVARVRQAGDRIQQTAQGINDGLSHAASLVKASVLPGWAVTRGVLAAVSAFRSGRGRQNRQLARTDHHDENRFVNEGGNDA